MTPRTATGLGGTADLPGRPKQRPEGRRRCCRLGQVGTPCAATAARPDREVFIRGLAPSAPRVLGRSTAARLPGLVPPGCARSSAGWWTQGCRCAPTRYDRSTRSRAERLAPIASAVGALAIIVGPCRGLDIRTNSAGRRRRDGRSARTAVAGRSMAPRRRRPSRSRRPRCGDCTRVPGTTRRASARGSRACCRASSVSRCSGLGRNWSGCGARLSASASRSGRVR